MTNRAAEITNEIRNIIRAELGKAGALGLAEIDASHVDVAVFSADVFCPHFGKFADATEWELACCTFAAIREMYRDGYFTKRDDQIALTV